MDLPAEIGAHFPIKDGYCHPDWTAIGAARGEDDWDVD